MKENKKLQWHRNAEKCSGRSGTDEENSETMVKENNCSVSDCGNVGGCDADRYVADGNGKGRCG